MTIALNLDEDIARRPVCAMDDWQPGHIGRGANRVGRPDTLCHGVIAYAVSDLGGPGTTRSAALPHPVTRCEGLGASWCGLSVARCKEPRASRRFLQMSWGELRSAMVTMMTRRRLHRRRCESQGERRNNTCSGPFVLHDVPPSTFMLGELEESQCRPAQHPLRQSCHCHSCSN